MGGMMTTIEDDCALPVSQRWRERPALTGTDTTDFLALRRVCGIRDSHVDKVGDRYFDGERPVLPFIEVGVIALIEVGHVTLGEPDPACADRQRVAVTASGWARYEDLCARQGIPPSPTPGLGGTSCL